MRRIVIRAPACSADTVSYLKRVFGIHAEELKPGERVEFSFDGERFPFPSAIFVSLMAGAGLKVVGAREEDGTRIFEAEKAPFA